jgi:hypothetical protein
LTLKLAGALVHVNVKGFASPDTVMLLVPESTGVDVIETAVRPAVSVTFKPEKVIVFPFRSLMYVGYVLKVPPKAEK